MAGSTGINAVAAIGRVEFEARFLAATLSNQRDVQELLGEQAIQLIQAAAINPPGTGENLDVRA